MAKQVPPSSPDAPMTIAATGPVAPVHGTYGLEKRIYRAIGMMSGTSLDGVDAALIETDGESFIRSLGASYVVFDNAFHNQLAAVASGDVALNDVLRTERKLMEHYILAVHQLKVDLTTIDVIGAHGQTIRHLPIEGLTWQLADPSYLSEHTGVPVVADFRRRDMAAGGQGAPLVPLFHQALLGDLQRPCGVLNIGGVANLTWFMSDGTTRASDTGPGAGLLDKLVRAKTGHPFDQDGRIALAGTVHHELVLRALAEMPFWRRPWPRSADRYEFDSILNWLAELSLEDACATLAALTAAGVRRTVEEWDGQGPLFVVGGGARNKALLIALRNANLQALRGESAGLPVRTMEAECFAWLAVRRLRGLPLSQPGTTGASHPTVGGVITWGPGPIDADSL